ncbi:MAG: flagellar export chaperone FliS [Verrucomicrobiaceae bacterium]|nr:flagellar export chaperone FliS [Verrucomicrobiaceae bacterium]
MVSQRALSQYQKVNSEAAVESASPHKLIQMLMQGCLQRIAEGRGALQRREIAAKGEAISKAINIVAGLQASLNKEVGGILPQQLDALYDYMQRRLIEANSKNSDAMLEEVAQLMRTVKEGWDGIDQGAAAKR